MSSPFADIEFVKRIVVEAGDRALAVCGSVAVTFKADSSLVTEVDLETERFLRAELEGATPGFAFVGEEFGWHGPSNVPVWACDPIDGTTNYVCGLPHWCVSVGLLVEGVPELGVVYLPQLGELFWATRGGGAFCNGAPIHAQDRDSLHPEDTICLTSGSMKTLNTEALAGRIRGIGSIASELVYAARGNLCATIGLHEGIVDMAAAFCICAEAGCEFRTLAGPPLDIPALLRAGRTKEHFICAPPRMAAFLQTLLRPR